MGGPDEAEALEGAMSSFLMIPLRRPVATCFAALAVVGEGERVVATLDHEAAAA